MKKLETRHRTYGPATQEIHANAKGWHGKRRVTRELSGTPFHTEQS